MEEHLEKIKKAHDLVCHARNLLNELSSDLKDDKDVMIEVDGIIDEWAETLENVEDPLFSGCNIEDINELLEAIDNE